MLCKSALSRGPILLVSSFDETRCALLRALSGAYRNVRVARSYVEAACQLGGSRIPIVICEARFDGGTWRELLDHSTLIVTSRVADEALWAEVLNLGGFDVLAQPFDRTEVLRVTDAALRYAGGAARSLSEVSVNV